MNAAPDQPTSGPEVIEADEGDALATLAGHAIALASDRNRRVLIGLAGGPGSGKSTLATKLVDVLTEAVPGSAALVPMDGFHRRHMDLIAAGTVDAKGAPHTFDAEAFVTFVAQLKRAEAAVSGPSYSREIEDVVPDAFSIAANVPILVIEGNYLLLDDGAWTGVRPLLDYAAFLDVDREVVRARLIKRHAEHGLFSEERNKRHIEQVDLKNFDLVARSSVRADLIFRIASDG